MGHVTKALWWICTPIWDFCSTKIRSHVAWQPALPWQAVCTQVVVCGLKCNHSSMKWVRSPIIMLTHILSVYITCSCDLGLWSIWIQIRSRDREFVLNVSANFEVYTHFRFWNRQSYFAVVCLESGPRIVHYMEEYCWETVGLEAAPRIIASIIVAKI